MAREMKNSGIEWIDEIPVNWKVMPHKYIMHKQKDICEHYNGEDIISLTMGGVIVRDLTAGGKMPTTFDGYQYVEPEDLLMCLFDIDVTPRCVGVVHNYGLTSPAYSRFKVHSGYYNGYYDYLLRFIDDEKVFIHLSKNLRSSLTETDFGAIKTIVPPYEEQKRIAEFLDRKCAEIDTVIEKTKATIEEYKKLKQSVITEAVTKGIRGDRVMKDSGIEWIGEIPTTFNKYRIKHIAELYGRIGFRGYTTDDLVDEGEGAITLSPSNLRDMTMSYSKLSYLTWQKYEESPEIKINNGDILMVKTGSSYGKTALVDNLPLEATINPQLIVIKNIKISTKYLLYCFQTPYFLDQVENAVVGGTIPTMAQEKIYNFYVFVPDELEQQEIVESLDKKCAEIDKLIADKTHLLEEMESYKKSVIYEYVTGKKEVVL